MGYTRKLDIIFPSILISLMPLFLMTGPFLSDLSLVIVIFFYLFNSIKEKNYSLFRSFFFKIFLFFYAYLIFNSIFNFYDYNNLRVSISYLRFGLYVLAVIYFLRKNEKIIYWLFCCFFVCFSILVIDGFYQYFFGINLTGYSLGHEKRVSSFFYDEFILGSYLARLSPIFFGLAFYLSKTKKKLLLYFFILFIFTQTLIFLSGERAAFFFSLMTTLFIVLMIAGYKKMKFFVIFFPIVLILLISIFNSKAKERIIDETLTSIGINSKEKNIFSKHHESHYMTAYNMYLDNKFVGIGLRNFRNFCSNPKYKIDEKSCSTHPHNTYIQLLAETGLIGFMFGIILFFYFCYHSLIHFKKKYLDKETLFNNFEICLLSSILVTLWPFIPTGNFFNNWLSIVYFYPVGFLLWSMNKN